jgi:hypothetical protein
MAAAEQPERLQTLLAALRRAFVVETASDPAARDELRRVAQLIAAIGDQPAELRPTQHPLTRHLSKVLERADQLAPEIAGALRPIASELPWRYGYAPRTDAPGLEAAMGWAELIGPQAPIVSTKVCFGLTLIAPHSFYPPHRHPAVELYRIVVGDPLWTVATTTSTQSPGALIFHDSNVVHAMRTGAEPLLAIYSWTGDLNTSSVWA